MTVCIAAISNNAHLFVASDRMRTSGDIQYEPEVPKIVELTTSIVMMTAGDSLLNREIIAHVKQTVDEAVDANPETWLDVRQVVDWYVWYRQEIKRKAAEAAILVPLGMNSQTFLAQQDSLNSDLVQEIARNLLHHPMPTVHVIIAGIDNNGPQIYSVRDGAVSYHNAVGFAAIGNGYWHVESEFTSSGHHPGRSVPETAALIYRAKRRAETAPGVGRATDFAMILAKGEYQPVGDHIHSKLAELYDAMAAAEKEARNRVYLELDSYVAELAIKRAQTQPTTQGVDGPDGSVDDANTRNAAPEAGPASTDNTSKS
ncbi:MAG: hypothetical protein EON58_22070 [Alphaproteobacteria bacterium]|nr:MAG: hypothetical protein EON58_22070 [Alphaproteobacteria bacterium]